jgi:ATP-dependent exoDNAse (exonuclease V) alpha subunit
MTVNKAQGQTIPNIGIYLPEPVFSHDQLYVALSRATARSNIRILAMPPNEKDVSKETGKGKGKGKRKNKPATDIFTKNIVYKEVLTP